MDRRAMLSLFCGAAVAPGAALADQPMRVSVPGCLSNGVFVTDEGTRYRVLIRDGLSEVPMPQAYEGQRLRLRGRVFRADPGLLHLTGTPERLGSCGQ